MKATHLHAADFSRQAWKNGGGFTTQLAVDDAQPWRWRLSLAEVRDPGPFSDFRGYERTIMLVEGAGMALTIDRGAPVELRRPHEPFVFDGGAATECALLGGPVKDLNLMVARDRARGSLAALDPDRFRGEALEARWTLVYALRGWTRVTAGDTSLSLAPGELLRIDDARGEELHLVGLDRTARIALARIDLP
jgi:environmental stress-induced protein Ves